MALHDYEQRKLDEIEKHLVEENPRMARRFAEFRPIHLITLVAAGLGLLVLLSVGLVVMVIGVRLTAPGLITLGAVLTATVPAAITWYLLRRAKPTK
ncbi:DUF3040 domain-containing protein [Amycolatopsis sp. NPDC059027]|uniref:DUF3040 domain-containing protein n=1 Tax=unclassified Amycolatopsis TaxID=2618356 RepID=UPI00366E6412